MDVVTHSFERELVTARLSTVESMSVGQALLNARDAFVDRGVNLMADDDPPADDDPVL